MHCTASWAPRFCAIALYLDSDVAISDSILQTFSGASLRVSLDPKQEVAYWLSQSDPFKLPALIAWLKRLIHLCLPEPENRYMTTQNLRLQR